MQGQVFYGFQYQTLVLMNASETVWNHFAMQKLDNLDLWSYLPFELFVQLALIVQVV